MSRRFRFLLGEDLLEENAGISGDRSSAQRQIRWRQHGQGEQKEDKT
jgi:hypothetical protein